MNSQHISRLNRVVLACLVSACILSNAGAASHPVKIGDPSASGSFELLREPSGVIAYDQNTLVVIEDEADGALSQVSISVNAEAALEFQETRLPAAEGSEQVLAIAPLDDLEAIARLSATQFLIAGSHQNAGRGKRPNREKLVLLTKEDGNIVDAQMRIDLFEQIVTHYPELAELLQAERKRDREPLNIEAMAYDRKRSQLHIGLRTPVIDEDSIVVILENAPQYLAGSAPIFAEKLERLDLNGAGIRALAYDDQSDQFLIISKPETGGKRRSRLWSLAAATSEKPIKFKSENKKLFEDVEGLVPFTDGIIFVRDQGSEQEGKLDDWFVLERMQLGLDD